MDLIVLFAHHDQEVQRGCVVDGGAGGRKQEKNTMKRAAILAATYRSFLMDLPE